MDGNFDIASQVGQVLSLKDDPKKAVAHLVSLQFGETDAEEKLKSIIQSLESDHKIDFLQLCLGALELGYDVFQVAHLLKIPDISNSNPKTLVDLLQIFSKKMEGDMASGMFHPTIEKLASENVSLGERIASEIRDRSSDSLGSYLLAVYVGISKTDFQKGYLAIKDLLDISGSEEKRALGIRGIGNLPEGIKDHKTEIFEFLKDANSSESMQIKANSAFSTLKLQETFDELSEDCEKLSKSDTPEVQYEVASYLRIGSRYKGEWQNRSLGNLFSVRSKYKGVIDCLDSILYSILKTENDWDLARQLLNEWISKRTVKETIEHRLDDHFPMSITLVATNQQFLSSVVTEWLNKDDVKFHRVVTDLFSYLSLKKVPPFYLDISVIETYTYEDAKYVIRKTLGYIFDFEYSAHLVFSFLLTKDPSQELINLVGSVLIEHLGYNFPHKMPLFFDKMKDSHSLSDRTISVVDELKGVVEGRIEQQKNLPAINEIRPELDLVMAIDNARYEMIQKASAEARKGSVLLDLVRNVSLKHGKGWFSYMNGKFCPPSMLKHISESAELPKADVLDVVGASMMRQGFRIAKRGQE